MTLFLLTLACAGRRAPSDALPEIAPEDYPSFEQLVQVHERQFGAAKEVSDSFYMRQLVSAPAQGLSGEIEFWSHQGMAYTRTDIEALGESTSGYDGQVAWEVDPNQGPKVLTEAESGPLRLMAMGNLSLSQVYLNAEVRGLVHFDSRPAWEVIATPATYDQPTKLYFELDTGLWIGTAGKVPSTMGSIRQTSVFRDWQLYDGIPAPGVTETKVLTLTLVTETVEIVQDPQELPSFGPPEGVRALLEE